MSFFVFAKYFLFFDVTFWTNKWWNRILFSHGSNRSGGQVKLDDLYLESAFIRSQVNWSEAGKKNFSVFEKYIKKIWQQRNSR